MPSKLAFALTLALTLPALAAEGPLIDSMDDLSSFNPAKEKGRLESVDGKVGKAIKFSFDNECSGIFFMGKVRANAEWDKAAGISFWVKGDGSGHCGGLQFIFNEDYAVRYTGIFPIDSTEWKKVVIPWRDLIPVMNVPGSKPLDPKDSKGANPPSKLSGVWFGKWWFWKDYAAHSYAIDELRLEPTIELDNNEFKPAGDPLARVQAKLKAGKPVTIVTMGDSLTDYSHNSNQVTNWPTMLKQKLKEKYKFEVTIVNPAIGGTELRQNALLIPRWAKTCPEPDLVTINFGGNDYNSMTGANMDGAARGAMFYDTYKDAIDRVRRATKGKADVLVLTPIPGVERWKEYAELVEASKKAGKEKSAGIADTDAAFHEAGKDNKERLFASDKIHLGAPGQETVANTVIAAIEKGGK